MSVERWTKDGYFIERMTEEEAQTGGVWVIGDQRPDRHPGKTDGRIIVKSWTTPLSKYGGDGYAPKTRIHENRWEYVEVLTGCFSCLVREREDAPDVPYFLSYRKSVDLAPAVFRRWSRPAEWPEAKGITICRPYVPTLGHVQGGLGDGYEYDSWDFWDHDKTRILDRPRRLSKWRVTYIELFAGSFLCTVGNACFSVCSGYRVFLAADAERSLWFAVEDRARTCGVVLHLQ